MAWWHQLIQQGLKSCGLAVSIQGNCIMRKPVLGVFDHVPHKWAMQALKMARGLGFRERDCTIYVAKTKVLISCAITTKADLRFCFWICKKQVFFMM